jgi:Methyltransferase domain
VERETPDLRVMVEILDGAGIAALVVDGEPSGTPSERGTPGTRARGRIELLVPKRRFQTAVRRFDDLGWRYSWSSGGPLRLRPSATFLWDRGPDVTLGWGVAAAPLPPSWMRELSALLWRTASTGPDGFLRPDPIARLVHLAAQSCRPGRHREADWTAFLAGYGSTTDRKTLERMAHEARVSKAVRRCVVAAEREGSRPGPGPLYGGTRDLAWRLAVGAQARARPPRLRRLLAGQPSFGDAPIRCRIDRIEVQSGPGVFVPAAEADMLVDEAVMRIGAVHTPLVVEVGTGCGAMALAIAARRPDAEIHGTDSSAAAIRWARRNAAHLGQERVTFHQGSILAPIPDRLAGHADLIFADLPYIPASDALTIGSVPSNTILGTGADGLDLVRALARAARPVLRPGGDLVVQMLAWQWERLGPELTGLGYRPLPPRRMGAFAIGTARLEHAGD